MRNKKSVSVAAGLSGFCLSALASAVSANTGFMLEEIVVTAQKRAQSTQDVPVAITAVGGEKLTNANIVTMADVSAYVPNFYMANTPFASVNYIRGVGSTPNSGFEQSVGMFSDDIYWGREGQSVTPLFDMGRVEVLKGPQSILFGKNTIGGAVALHSNQPTEEFEGKISALYGTDGEDKLELVLSGPLAENLNGRLAAFSHTSDGYIKNSYDNSTGPETRKWGVRGMLNWQPSDELDVNLKLEHTSSQSDGIGVSVIGVSPSAFIPQLNGVDASDEYKNNIGNSGLLSDQSNNDVVANNAVLKLDYDWNGFTLTSITGYTGYQKDTTLDTDYSPVSFVSTEQDKEYDQYSQEFRITSEEGEKFDYIAGLYFQYGDVRVTDPTTFLGSAVGITPAALAVAFGNPALAGGNSPDGIRIPSFDQTTTTASAFFQGSWHFTEALTLKAGLRYNYESKEMDRSVDLLNLAGSPFGSDLPGDGLPLLFWQNKLNTVVYEESQDRKENHLSPQLTLEWIVNEDAMIYASVTQGNKSGGWNAVHYNGADLSSLSFEDEKALSYEVGIKSNLLDNRVMLNASVFYNEIDNLQVSEWNGIGYDVSNAAKSISQGIEVDGRFLVTEQLELSASLGYLSYEYEDYQNAPCTQAQADAVYVASGGSTSSCVQDLSGESTINAPEWTASLSGAYTAALTENLNLGLTVDANYRGSHFLDTSLDASTEQDGAWKVNARLSLTPVSETWQVSIIGKNLTDELTYAWIGSIPLANGHAFQQSDAVGSFAGAPSAPRSIAIEGSLYF
jgi:iron complex outermembrane recepter protein